MLIDLNRKKNSMQELSIEIACAAISLTPPHSEGGSKRRQLQRFHEKCMIMKEIELGARPCRLLGSATPTEYYYFYGCV